MNRNAILPPPIFVVFALVLSIYLPSAVGKVIILIHRTTTERPIPAAGEATVAQRFTLEKRHAAAAPRRPTVLRRLMDYILDRRYDKKPEVLGRRFTEQLLAGYTAFRRTLNDPLYRLACKEIPLLPLQEQGGTPTLIERSKDPFLLPPPARLKHSVDVLLRPRLAFFHRLVRQHPELNVFLYDVQEREYSRIYQELVPRAQYETGFQTLWNDFVPRLPSSVSCAQLNYDLTEFRTLFYRTDHHWTIRGAWTAYAQVLDLIRAKVPEIGDTVWPREEFRVGNLRFRGSYAKTSAYEAQADELRDIVMDLPPCQLYYNGTIELPRSDRDLLAKGRFVDEGIFANYYGMYWGHDYGFIRYQAATGKRHLLLFGDSASNCMEAFFTAHYSQVFKVDLRYYARDVGRRFSLREFLRDQSVDDVLFLIRTRALVLDSEEFPFPTILEE